MLTFLPLNYPQLKLPDLGASLIYGYRKLGIGHYFFCGVECKSVKSNLKSGLI